MRQLGGFLSALGQMYGGLAKDRQQRRENDFQDLQASNLRSTMRERDTALADAAKQRQVLAENWGAASSGDAGAQARIVSVLPNAASLFQQRPTTPAPPRTLSTSKGILQWDEPTRSWKPTGYEPPERSQDSRPVVVQGAQGGPVVVDPRRATSRPVVQEGSGERQHMTPPANIATAYRTNAKQVGSIRNTIKLVQAHPTAVGLKRGWVDDYDQRADPDGVNARAGVADIGSMVIHDRSGAAVTVAEYPRLAPFIPKIRDDHQTVIKKLNRMAQIIEEDNLSMADQYPALAAPAQPLAAQRRQFSPENPFARKP